MSDFYFNLNKGLRYEDFIIDILEKYNFSLLRKSDPNDLTERKKFDLLMKKDNKNVKFEIKSDIYLYETGNEVFEYSHNNKRSGIMITESDYWITCHILQNRITMYKTKELKELCTEIIKGSDKNYKLGTHGKSKIILINHELMKKYLPFRKDINIEIPVYDKERILNYFINNNSKYTKIIEKLKSLI